MGKNLLRIVTDGGWIDYKNNQIWVMSALDEFFQKMDAIGVELGELSFSEVKLYDENGEILDRCDFS